MELDPNIIIKERYELLKQLGEGSFGEVWLAEDTLLNGLKVAIKFYQRTDSEGQAAFTREYTRVQRLHHDNLLTASYFDVWQRRPFLVMDYCSEGAARRYRGKMTEQQIWHFIHDVAAGLAYMHAQEPTIIHQDIKPDNVLIHGDGRYVITDFGISRSALSGSGSSEALKSAGTTAYMGPGRFTSTPQTIMASDIWSLGASIYELATGNQPFMGPDGYGMGGVAFKLGFEMPQLPSNFSRELNALMQACLEKETWDRPTAKVLEEYTSAYLKGENPKAPWKEKHSSPTQPNPRPWDTSKNGQTPPPQPKPYSAPKPKKDLLKKIILIVLLSFLVIGMIWLIVKKMHSTNEPTQDNSADTSGEIIAQNRIPENFVLCPKGTLLHYYKGWDWKKRENFYVDVPLDSFYISKYELTQKEWNEIIPEKTNHYYKGDSLPAYDGDFFHACIYCNRRSRNEGYDGFYSVQNNQIIYNPKGNGYRLPNEYEWAYAARGGEKKTTKYAAGNNLNEIAWYGGNSGGHPHNVGQKKPNSIGLYDMNGNIGESLWPSGDESSGCPIFYHPSDFDVYIGFSENDHWCGSGGIRLVFVPKNMKNSNIQYTKLENMKVADTLAVLF